MMAIRPSVRLLFPIVLLVIAAGAVAAIGVRGIAAARGVDAAEPAPLNVVATTGMIADLVRVIAGDRVELVQLIASGVDPHLYAPTRRDMLRLESAQVIYHNGFRLEGRLGEAIAGAATPSRHVHAVAELVVADGYAALREDDGAAGGSEVGEVDPHLWMDVAAWAKAATVIGRTLADADPKHAETHRRKAEELATRLRALDGHVRAALDTVPETRRLLVTAHDAFGYFGRAYAVEVHGIQGISTESEAGIRRIAQLADLIAARRVPAVFAESTVADRSVRALIEASQSRGHRVVLGGELHSDAMGAGGTWRGTYIGMIDHNVATIVRALGGQVPDGGLRSLLDPETPSP